MVKVMALILKGKYFFVTGFQVVFTGDRWMRTSKAERIRLTADDVTNPE
jgi:hypothetical protein